MADFIDFTETTNPDNRFTYANMDETDEIVIGGTCKHVFRLPFVYTSYAQELLVTYSQGLYTICQFRDITGSSDPHLSFVMSTTDTIVTVTLNPDDTEKFDDNTLDTFVQLKVTKKPENGETGDVIYDKPCRLNVVKPLEFKPLKEENE